MFIHCRQFLKGRVAGLRQLQITGYARQANDPVLRVAQSQLVGQAWSANSRPLASTLRSCSVYSGPKRRGKTIACDHRSAIALEHHQAFGFETLEGFAYRDFADVELAGNIVLANRFIFSEMPGDDSVAQMQHSAFHSSTGYRVIDRSMPKTCIRAKVRRDS